MAGFAIGSYLSGKFIQEHQNDTSIERENSLNTASDQPFPALQAAPPQLLAHSFPIDRSQRKQHIYHLIGKKTATQKNSLLKNI